MSSQSFLPYKHVAVALLFSVFLGPVGLLYASFWGGIILLVPTILVIFKQFYFDLLIIWLICCIWSVRAVEKHNRKLRREMQLQG